METNMKTFQPFLVTIWLCGEANFLFLVGSQRISQTMKQCLARRQAHLLRAQHGIPISDYGVLVDMIRVHDWVFEVVGQELRAMGQDAATYHPRLYLTAAQVSTGSRLLFSGVGMVGKRTHMHYCMECLSA